MTDSLVRDAVFAELIYGWTRQNHGEELVQSCHHLCRPLTRTPELSPENRKDLNVLNESSSPISKVGARRKCMRSPVEQFSLVALAPSSTQLFDADGRLRMI